MAFMVSEFDRHTDTMFTSVRMTINEEGDVLVTESIRAERRSTKELVFKVVIHIGKRVNLVKLKQVAVLKQLLPAWSRGLLLLAIDDFGWPTACITQDEIAGRHDKS